MDSTDFAQIVADQVGDHLRYNTGDAQIPPLDDWGTGSNGTAWFQFTDGTRATITVTIERRSCQ